MFRRPVVVWTPAQPLTVEQRNTAEVNAEVACALVRLANSVDLAAIAEKVRHG